MKCFLALVLCALVLGADAFRYRTYRGSHHGRHQRGPRRHGYMTSTAVCEDKGGECMPSTQCKTDTSLITGTCDSDDGQCCVTREFACEKWHSGRCVSEMVGCSDLDGYRTCGMSCSEGVVCCVPENMGQDKRPDY